MYQIKPGMSTSPGRGFAPFWPRQPGGPALFVGGWALAQLWLFWIAPLIGGVLGGAIYRWLSEEPGRGRRRQDAGVSYFLPGVTSVTWPILRPGRGAPLP
jgi:hypothetical protein